MAYLNDPGTQANGAAGSQTQPSIMNAAVQAAPATGQSPAMAAASAAADSYKPASARRARMTAAAAGPGPSYQTREELALSGRTGVVQTPQGAPPPAAPAPGTSSWGMSYGGTPSDEWLNKMQDDVRASGAQTMSDQMRALQANMATRPGMLQSGAAAAAAADLYRRGGNEMQGELSKAMLGQYEGERNRQLQAWGTKYGADAAAAAQTQNMSAQLMAQADNQRMQNEQFGREMALKEGLGYGGLGLDWYTAEGNLNLGRGQLDLGWGGLANDRFGMQNQFDLGMGQLDFGYAQMDNDYLMQYLNLAGGAGADLGGIAGGPGWTEGLTPEMIAALQQGG